MKRKQYTEEQIGFVLRQAEAGTPIGEVCRKAGISEQTFSRWKKKFAGTGVVDLTLDKTMSQEVDKASKGLLNSVHSSR